LKFTAFELGGFWNLAGRPLELLKSSQLCPWFIGEEEQGCRQPNSGEVGGRGWRRAVLRAPGAHSASMGGLGRKRGLPKVGFPRRPRRRRRGAHRRGASRRGGWPSLGLIAVAGGGEASGMVGLDGGGVEVRARRRQDLTEEE
jgi:hypothetical protein